VSISPVREFIDVLVIIVHKSFNIGKFIITQNLSYLTCSHIINILAPTEYLKSKKRLKPNRP